MDQLHVLKVAGGLCVVALLVAVVAAPAQAQLADLPGSRDPAGVKRYEGSVAIGYTFSRFDAFTFLTGPVKRSTLSTGPRVMPTKSEQAEGQRTRLLYVVPAGRSPLEVIRNYEQELGRSGYQVVYRCRGAECGTEGATTLATQYLYTAETQLSQTPAAGSGRPPGQISADAFHNATDQHFLTARRGAAPGDAWISVYAATAGFELHKETFGRTVVLVDSVERAPMESKMVTVDAAAMARDIGTTGHVALYGILFDTDRTEIKPESASTIAEIAALLKQQPAMKLYVVGHTDNVGAYDYNVGLSQRRAAAVVQELTTKHGVAAARLKAAGSGPVAPVASNDSDAGRAKNRRVELVKQ